MTDMSAVPILSVKVAVIISTVNFDGDGNGDGICKQAIRGVVSVITGSRIEFA